MIKKLLWLFLLLPIYTQAQISGRLLDSETQEPIPYAQITVAHPKTQIYTTENGHFSFTQLDKNTSYVLHIDALGYFNKEMNSSELNHQQDIYLDLNEEVLPELYIIPENAKTRIRTYGQTREGSGKIQGGYSGRYLEEIKLTSEQSDITDNTGITVNTKGLSKVLSAHLHIAGNSYKKASIKIQLYDIANEKPIIHAPIIFNIVDKQTGWFKINLEDENIYIDSNIKKVAMMLDLVAIESYNKREPASLNINIIFPSFNTMAIGKNDNDKLIKAPFSFPLYLTVETYSW